VFLHGYGGSSLDNVWAERKAHSEGGADLRFCAGDRPGYGWSDAGPLPRCTPHVIERQQPGLHALECLAY